MCGPMQEKEGKFRNEMQRLTGALRKSSVIRMSWELLGPRTLTWALKGKGSLGRLERDRLVPRKQTSKSCPDPPPPPASPCSASQDSRLIPSMAFVHSGDGVLPSRAVEARGLQCSMLTALMLCRGLEDFGILTF